MFDLDPSQSPSGKRFVQGLLHYDFTQRPKTLAAKLHSWFSNPPGIISDARFLPRFDESKKAEWARQKKARKKKKIEQLTKNNIHV